MSSSRVGRPCPSQATQRSTIFKAIKGGRLSARKDDGGQFRIDPAELARVFAPAGPGNGLRDGSGEQADTGGELRALQREMYRCSGPKVMMPLRHSTGYLHRDSKSFHMIPGLPTHLEDVVDMVGFSVKSLKSLLSDMTPDAMTDGTGPITLIRRSDNGIVTVTGRNIVSVTSGTETLTMDANGARINLMASGFAEVALGTTPTTMKFLNMAAITLAGGAATATIIADNGSHTFISGKGALTITGGAGANNYVYHRGSALMTVQDFSVAKGDILMIDKTLQGLMSQISDNRGGTMLRFGSATAGIDVKGMATLSPTSIHWI